MSVYGLTPGMQCYKYTLTNLISNPANSQSDVWLAQDTATQRTVALKVMDAASIGIPQRLYEAQFGAKLKHANLCEVVEADVFELPVNQPSGPPIAVPFVAIAFHYHPKGSCTGLLEGPGMLRVQKVHRLLLDVLAGLDYLHEQGWLHNDVKPANILVGTQDQFMLTDYGIAWQPARGATNECYLPHISPESLQLTGGKLDPVHAPSFQTDLYQLGVTAYRLLNGIDKIRDDFQLARQTGKEAEFYQRVKDGKIPNRDKYHPSVPRSLRRIVNKSMSLVAADRYPSALAMRRELEKLHFPYDWQFDASGEMLCDKKGVVHRVDRSKTSTGNTVVLVKTFPSGQVHRPSASRFAGLSDEQAERKTHDIMQEVMKP